MFFYDYLPVSRYAYMRCCRAIHTNAVKWFFSICIIFYSGIYIYVRVHIHITFTVIQQPHFSIGCFRKPAYNQPSQVYFISAFIFINERLNRVIIIKFTILRKLFYRIEPPGRRRVDIFWKTKTKIPREKWNGVRVGVGEGIFRKRKKKRETS